ncbi:PepSY-associated TM helix domain-containing protein [Methylobacterium sp. J-090]|uniref:PepSY-associated TM helix domain-containing protein n=1 Tax=Methylobacterium sp. J-090 TaxID=2836666 RepID=UPI001FB87187|nr:PepSY domain-containing protein [Methylobacterium sp. J-090]MCJ2080014.1 PepSY domain-containing protein [Methylobacterium sp. J-090]
MPPSLTGEILAAPARLSREAVYRAVWRWHFYAGLVCLPFLILLSTTGALYLFKDEINAALFTRRFVVPASAEAPLGPDRLVYVASQAVPDATPLTYLDPAGPTAPAVVTLAKDGVKTLVTLDPRTGDILGRVAADGEVMAVIRRLHSLSYFGRIANGIVEVVAGFLIVLVITGTYLWWPRGQSGGQPGGVVSVRGTPRRRVWWRDLHAVTGFVAGGGLLFLALTGLPWSIVWGQQLRALSNAAGLGQPSALWARVPVSTVPMGAALTTAGWALEEAPVPLSRAAPTAPIGLDRAAAILGERGMPAGYELALPVGETGVYAAAAYPRDVTRQRMISLDQYTGQALVDVRFSEIGIVGRAIQWGIGLHKGEVFGRLNQFLMLAICLAGLLLSVTAGVMWWKRRPSGSLGIPPWPRAPGIVAGVTLLVVGLGVLFPLTGAAILGMILLDGAGRALAGRIAA